MQLRRQLASSLKEKVHQADFWLHCGVFALLGFIFLPATLWFAAGTHEQSRLLNAMLVLVMATVILVRFGGVEIKNTFNLNPSARRALIACFVLLVAQFIAARFAPAPWRGPASLLVIPAYCCALAAAVRYVFGEGTNVISRTACAALGVFLSISVFMGPLDWPLRGLAGRFSAEALALIGKPVQLGLIGLQAGPPKLILLVDTHPFHVASECNGFGVILTSLMLSLLLAIYRRRGPLGIFMNLSIGLALGFSLNILRIVVIVLLAPYLMDHYMLMHEFVGTITYWGSLILIWIVLKGPTKPETA